jgi:hypothetical protein
MWTDHGEESRCDLPNPVAPTPGKGKTTRKTIQIAIRAKASRLSVLASLIERKSLPAVEAALDV